MDLSTYKLEDLFFTAIKAEIDSKEAYSIMAGITNNAFLKDRFRFLAEEEEKHRTFLTEEFKRHFRLKKLDLPKVSPVPLPEIDTDNEKNPLSVIIEQAMNAEKVAYDFYISFSKFVKENSKLASVLGYFAKMEESHYQMLKQELEAVQEFETFDEFNPLMHAGP